MSDLAITISRETEAARALLHDLSEIIAESDHDLRLTTIEGETNLFEAVDAVLVRLGLIAAHTDALGAQLADLQARKARFVAQEERLRQLLQHTLDACQIRKMERPTATISIRQLPRRMEPVDEALIPEEFIIVERRLNKSAILKALKDGRDIPGCRLSNGGETIGINPR